MPLLSARLSPAADPIHAMNCWGNTAALSSLWWPRLQQGRCLKPFVLHAFYFKKGVGVQAFLSECGRVAERAICRLTAVLPMKKGRAKAGGLAAAPAGPGDTCRRLRRRTTAPDGLAVPRLPCRFTPVSGTL